MKLLLLLLFVGIAWVTAINDQVTELPTPLPLIGAGLISNSVHHSLAKRETVPTAPKASSSESSEEKKAGVDTVARAGKPVGVIPDVGVPVVDVSRRKRDLFATESPTDDPANKNYGVTEPPKAAVTPQGVEKDDGLPDLGFGSRKRRDSPPKESSSSSSEEKGKKDTVTVGGTPVTPIGAIADGKPEVIEAPKQKRDVTETQKSEDIGGEAAHATDSPTVAPMNARRKRDLFATESPTDDPANKNYGVTEPPKAAVTPQGVEKDDGLPDLGFGSRKRRASDYVGDKSYPYTEPPQGSITPLGIEKPFFPSWLTLGLEDRKRRDAPIRAERHV